jgi:hypothetical protein
VLGNGGMVCECYPYPILIFLEFEAFSHLSKLQLFNFSTFLMHFDWPKGFFIALGWFGRDLPPEMIENPIILVY